MRKRITYNFLIPYCKTLFKDKKLVLSHLTFKRGSSSHFLLFCCLQKKQAAFLKMTSGLLQKDRSFFSERYLNNTPLIGCEKLVLPINFIVRMSKWLTEKYLPISELNTVSMVYSVQIGFFARKILSWQHWQKPSQNSLEGTKFLALHQRHFQLNLKFFHEKVA